MTSEQNLEMALFRYALIHPLLSESLTKGERAAIKKEIVEKEHNIPNSVRAKIALRTLNEYLQWYRERGFDGLIKGKRRDAGVVKAISSDILEKAFEFKQELPTRSIREIIEMLEMSGHIEAGKVKNSTLSRLIANNAVHLKLTSPKSVKTFGRFQKEHVNDTWQLDAKHGIYIPDPKNPKEYIRTYFICFLDDRSRMVSGKVYFSENAENVEDCLRKALIQMGVPSCIYTDNAKAFRTKRLQIICAELGCVLKYCRPYSPSSKGKVEKFYSFVDRSFEPEARQLNIKTLYELNQYFECWLSENYNNKIHSETKMTPVQACENEKHLIKTVSPEMLREIFICREFKKVSKAATITVFNRPYKVEGCLSNKKIEIRYDIKDLSIIEVYLGETRYKDAEPFKIKVNVWDGTQTEPDKNLNSGNAPAEDNQETVKTSYLKLLKEENEKKLRDKSNRINYKSLYNEKGGGSNV